MNTQFKESFNKDLRKIRDKDLLHHAKAIIETVEQAQSLGEIPNLERLKGWSKYYRIRVGDYRVGLAIEGCGDLCSVLAPKGYLQVFSVGARPQCSCTPPSPYTRLLAFGWHSWKVSSFRNRVRRGRRAVAFAVMPFQSERRGRAVCGG